jgi:hypothetical protein
MFYSVPACRFRSRLGSVQKAYHKNRLTQAQNMCYQAGGNRCSVTKVSLYNSDIHTKFKKICGLKEHLLPSVTLCVTKFLAVVPVVKSSGNACLEKLVAFCVSLGVVLRHAPQPTAQRLKRKHPCDRKLLRVLTGCSAPDGAANEARLGIRV